MENDIRADKMVQAIARLEERTSYHEQRLIKIEESFSVFSKQAAELVATFRSAKWLVATALATWPIVSYVLHKLADK